MMACSESAIINPGQRSGVFPSKAWRTVLSLFTKSGLLLKLAAALSFDGHKRAS